MQENEKEARESQPVWEDGAGTGQPRSAAQPVTPTPWLLTEKQKRWQYFLSLVLGFIPVIVLLVTTGIGFSIGNGYYTLLSGGFLGLILLALILYIIELIVMIVYLNIAVRRFIGYGLLTAFLITPVVTVIGCTVIPYLIHP